MTLEDDINILSSAAPFTNLTREQLRLLAFGAESIQVPKGRMLFRQGAKADCAFVVSQGQFTLEKEESGRRVIVDHAGPGSVLGSFALIFQTSRSLAARAEEDSVVIRLSRTLFRRIMEEYPEVAAQLHEEISGQLKEMITKLTALEHRFRESQ